jgi:hypothetical protein
VLLKPRSRTRRPQFPSRNSPVRLGASETLTHIWCLSARRSSPSFVIVSLWRASRHSCKAVDLLFLLNIMTFCSVGVVGMHR